MAATKVNPFVDKTNRVLALVKAFMQETPNLMTVYLFENTGQDIGNEGRAPRNTTDQLRIRSAKLSRAFTPNEEGNISLVDGKKTRGSMKADFGQRNLIDQNLRFNVEFGIDLKVVPYARIHEYGGTIKHPGGTPYFIGEDGLAKFVSKANARPDMPRTKPHNIEIKARPYMRPAFDSFIEKEVPRFFKRLAKELQS